MKSHFLRLREYEKEGIVVVTSQSKKRKVVIIYFRGSWQLPPI